MNDIDRFIMILHEKFEETFPDTFVKCRTLDKDLYDSSNGSMYSWYMTFVNCFSGSSLEGKYKRTREDMINSVNHVDEFLSDLQKEKHWIKFLVEFMPSNY